MGQPDHAQLFRAAFHQLRPPGLGGNSVEREAGDWRPRNGVVLVGKRPSARHDYTDDRQVISFAACYQEPCYSSLFAVVSIQR